MTFESYSKTFVWRAKQRGFLAGFAMDTVLGRWMMMDLAETSLLSGQSRGPRRALGFGASGDGPNVVSAETWRPYLID